MITVAIPTLSNAQGDVLKEFVKTCRSLNDDRVRIAHGFWVIGSEGRGELHHVSRQRLEAKEHFNEAEVIATKADELRSLTRALLQILRN
jgi:hypothetical protein